MTRARACTQVVQSVAQIAPPCLCRCLKSIAVGISSRVFSRLVAGHAAAGARADLSCGSAGGRAGQELARSEPRALTLLCRADRGCFPDELVAELRARPEVAAVFPAHAPGASGARLGRQESIVGRTIYTELIIDGIDPAAVTEPTDQVTQRPRKPEQPVLPKTKLRRGHLLSWD